MHRAEQCVTVSHTHTFTHRHWYHHWRVCVCLYDQCWPQRIWPSFRNNGHGEWLVGWASWLWEVTGGMLNDMPRMERWSERQREEEREERGYTWAILDKGLLPHWATKMFWLRRDRGWGKEKGKQAGKVQRKRHERGRYPKRWKGRNLMEECITRVEGRGEDDGLAGSRSGSLDSV